MCLWCDLTDSGRKSPVLWASLFLLCALSPVSLALMRSCMHTIDRYTLRPRISLLHTDHYRLSPLECCSWVVRPPWQRDSIFDDSHGVTACEMAKSVSVKIARKLFLCKDLELWLHGLWVSLFCYLARLVPISFLSYPHLFIRSHAQRLFFMR